MAGSMEGAERQLRKAEAQLVTAQLNVGYALENVLKRLASEPEPAKPARVPHRCPVCDGWGRMQGVVSATPPICKACDGTGIVWEPAP